MLRKRFDLVAELLKYIKIDFIVFWYFKISGQDLEASAKHNANLCAKQWIPIIPSFSSWNFFTTPLWQPVIIFAPSEKREEERKCTQRF